MTFLQVLARLLSLDAERVLDPTQPSFAFIFNSYCGFLTLRSAKLASGSIWSTISKHIAGHTSLHKYIALPQSQYI